jgi:hypothetical protein
MTSKVFDTLNSNLNPDDTPENEITIPDENPLSILVGDGKYYRSEAELAKGVIEKDKHIARLEAENAAQRNELVSRGRVEDAIDKLLQRNPQNSAPSGLQTPQSGSLEAGNNGQTSTATQKALTLEDVQRVLVENERTKQVQANTDKVRQALVERYGNRASTVYVEKAASLGVTTSQLDALAANNPSVLLELFPPPSNKAGPENNIPQNRVNTTGTPNVGVVRNQKYYNDLMKKSQRDFLSPRVQAQMYKDAMEQKEKFYE